MTSPTARRAVFDLAQGGLRQGRLEPNTQPNGAAMTLLRLWARVPRNTGPALFYRLRWRPRSAERCSIGIELPLRRAGAAVPAGRVFGVGAGPSQACMLGWPDQ